MRTPFEIARTIDHTLLRPEAGPAEVDRLCEEAVRFRFAGICVNPVYVRRVADLLGKLLFRPAGGAAADPSVKSAIRPAIVSVAGFPLGANHLQTKQDEARRAFDDGATEIDMVIHVGALIAGDYKYVRDEIAGLARVAHGGGPKRTLKVILECATLTEAQMIAGCRCCAEGEADFVKTSTGFHPCGGATIDQVRLLNRHAAPIKVKASGGIRTAAAAAALVDAGASRIGTSSGVSIMQELARVG